MKAAATIHVAEMKNGHMQLRSDEWRTEWKYDCSKTIHRYQNQILNRNYHGNVTKERDKLTQGIAKLTTDKPRLCVHQ